MPVAFPGAEGFGANTIGGRGGTIYRVTNLNDGGAGSFRAACEASGPRIVLFDVGGTIELASSIVITNPNISIFGQTAPPDSGGITLKNAGTLTQAPLMLRADEIILQYIRCRPGPGTAPTSSLSSIQAGISSGPVRNIIIDHCSFSWSVDQVLTLWYDLRNVTVQWCIISEGLDDSNHAEDKPHSRGSNIGSGQNGGHVSVHHCLFAHNKERNPLITTGGSYPVEFINNVIYNPNWTTMPKGSYGSSPRVNVISNYYKWGVDTSTARYEVEPRPTDTGSGDPRIYVRGNRGPRRPNGNEAENACVRPDYHSWVVTTPFDGSGSVTEQTATDAYASVLAGAGCRIPHFDSVDSRIVTETQSGTAYQGTAGSIIDDPADVGGWPSLAAGTAWVDSDGDGMPDAYELSVGLNPASATDGPAVAPDGYTNVEKFAHYLAAGGDVTEPPPGETTLIQVEQVLPYTADTGTPLTTGSWTPEPDKLLLVAIETRRTSASGTYSLSGNGLTWTKIGEVVCQDNTPERHRISVWKAWSGAAPSAGGLTFTYDNNASGVIIAAIQLGGVDETDQVEVVETHDSGATLSTNLQLAITPLTNNALVIGFGGYRGATTFTPPAGQTGISLNNSADVGGGADQVNLSVWHLPDAAPNTEVSVGGTGVLSGSTNAIAVAIAVAPAPALLTPPAAPDGLAVTGFTDTAVSFSWASNSSNHTGFSIERSPDGDTGWAERDTVAADVTTYTDTGLDPGTAYFYRVRAFNLDGYSDYSNTASATTYAALLVADFSAQPVRGFAPLRVSFTNLSEAFAGALITGVEWDFGDGATATTFNAEHTYAPGTYTVTLTLAGEDASQNPLEDDEVKSNYIVSLTIAALPIASAEVPQIPANDVLVSAEVLS